MFSFLFALLMVFLVWGTVGACAIGIITSYAKAAPPSQFALWVTLWVAFPAYLFFHFTEPMSDTDPSLWAVLRFMFTYQDDKHENFSP